MTSHANPFNDLKWKNRILLIICEHDDARFEDQIKELSHDPKGLAERKMAVFHVRAESSEQIITAFDQRNSSAIYEHYSKQNRPFEIVLIGLDGGTKWRQQEIMTLDTLYTIIDGMPMRKQEVRSKSHSH